MYFNREKFKITTKNNTNLPKNHVNSINLIFHVGHAFYVYISLLYVYM